MCTCVLHSFYSVLLSRTFASEAQQKTAHTFTFTFRGLSVLLSVCRAESERNPWVVLTSALLTRCQASEVKLDLGQQVVTMVRSLYNTKHKLPAQVNIKHSLGNHL